MSQPVRRAVREDLGPAIVKAAAALFADRGFEATTMQNIAIKVGITAAGLYYYFPSKQELLFEVLKVALDALVASEEDGVGAVPGDVPHRPVGELLAFTYRHVKFQLEELEESAVYGAAFYGTHFMLNALSEGQLVELRQLQARSYGLLRRILDDGVREGLFAIGEPAAAASAIIALGEFSPAWYKPGGRLTPHDVAALYAEFAFRMVAADGMARLRPDRIAGADYPGSSEPESS